MVIKLSGLTYTKHYKSDVGPMNNQSDIFCVLHVIDLEQKVNLGCLTKIRT